MEFSVRNMRNNNNTRIGQSNCVEISSRHHCLNELAYTWDDALPPPPPLPRHIIVNSFMCLCYGLEDFSIFVLFCVCIVILCNKIYSQINAEQQPCGFFLSRDPSYIDEDCSSETLWMKMCRSTNWTDAVQISGKKTRGQWMNNSSCVPCSVVVFVSLFRYIRLHISFIHTIGQICMDLPKCR